MTAQESPEPDGSSDAAPAHAGAAVGLEPGTRFKCEGCGNLTRFDVVATERTQRYWHVSVSGVGEVEESVTQEQTIHSVTCRWCGSSDRIVTEPAPVDAIA
ncbi:hypothetical protein [Euzebya tangerina]|uniref:hypothetical protein n=1 Tax=Euzebya tangerina TaxID=591198 RepID=UPI00196B1D98|nr:hypothetical protein [Euzebya tangerina]